MGRAQVIGNLYLFHGIPILKPTLPYNQETTYFPPLRLLSDPFNRYSAAVYDESERLKEEEKLL